MIPRDKLEHILEYARQKKQSGAMACRVPPADMVEIMERMLAGEGNSSSIPNGSGLIPVPDEFLSAEQNERGLFELSEDCMVRLAVALAQQSKGGSSDAV